jgi:hypothetical protein
MEYSVCCNTWKEANEVSNKYKLNFGVIWYHMYLWHFRKIT